MLLSLISKRISALVYAIWIIRKYSKFISLIPINYAHNNFKSFIQTKVLIRIKIFLTHCKCIQD